MYGWFAFVMVLVFMIVVAWLWREGMWSNAITLFNVITAALLATSLWEPLADFLDGVVFGATYLADFVSLWLIFLVCFSIFRGITDKLSKVRVRFKMPVETAGGAIFSIWVGCVIVCFATMSLHMAPLARDGLGGAFSPKQGAKTVLMFAPDRAWLGFVTKLSKEGGALVTTRPNPFDPKGEFVFKYGQRRANYETAEGILVDAKR